MLHSGSDPPGFACSPSVCSSHCPTTHIWGIGELATLNLGVNQSVNGCPWQPVQSVPHLLPVGSWESDPIKGKAVGDQWMSG